MQYLSRNLLMIAVVSCGVMLTISHADTQAVPVETLPVTNAPAPVATTTPVETTAATPAATTPPAATQADANQNLVEKKQETIPEGKKLVARVVWVKGGFNALMPGSTEKRPLKLAANIYMNDTLVTDKDSEAQIIFTDNSTMTFRPDTKLYINEYNYVPKAQQQKAEKKSAGKYILDLVTGGFRTVTGMVAKENPNDYAVNTPVATIGVRGTEYSLVYKQGQDLYIKRYTGEPCMVNDATKGGGKKGVVEKTNVGGGGAAAAGKGNEVCLDEIKQYGYVTDTNTNPVAIVQQPEVFRTDVEIVPVKFKETGDFGSVTSPGKNIDGSGPGSSGFCIQ
jgi:hypothetical protein